MAKIKKIGGMWYSDLRIGGKRVRKPLSIYEPKAQILLGDMIKTRQAKRHGTIPEDMSWEFFKEQFRKHRVGMTKRTKYFTEYMFRVVEEEIDPRLLGDLTPERLLDLKATLLGEDSDYGSVMAVRLLREVKTAMHFAENMKFVPLANWRTISLVEPEGRLDFYEKQAFLDLLAALKEYPSVYTAAFIMGRAGLRLGEFWHLEWRDVQFMGRQIMFRSKPYLGWRIKSDVKGKLVRQIPLSIDPADPLQPKLEAHLKSIARPSGFVLSEDRCGDEETWGARRFSPILAKTGVLTFLGDPGTAHILRHTFGSHLAQDNVSLTQIRDWMGHTSIRMTEQYAHLMPGNQSGFTLKPPQNGLSTSCPLPSTAQPTKAILSNLVDNPGQVDLPTNGAKSALELGK